jgi:hypothetical protein
VQTPDQGENALHPCRALKPREIVHSGIYQEDAVGVMRLCMDGPNVNCAEEGEG